MKKLTLTFAIILGMSLGALAQNSSSLFHSSNDGDSQSFFEYLQELFTTEEDAEEAFAIDNQGGGMFGGGGLFRRGATSEEYTPFGGNRNGSFLNLPSVHGSNDDQDTPLGSGIAMLLGLGGAYLVAKKRKEKA